MSRVRVGCIGAGWWATTNHFPLLAARDDVELVAVCRPDPDVLSQVQKTFRFRYGFQDYRELLSVELDAVVVTTPHHLHYEHAAQALKRKLHVLCEKPLTLQAGQAWDLVRGVERQNTHFLIPYGWHYKPFLTTARRMMSDGAVGEVEFVQCHMASPTKAFFSGTGGVPRDHAPTLLAPDPRTWQISDNGGGYAHGQLTHSTALMFWLTGLRASEVRAVTTSPASAVDMYDAATAVLDNGAIASISGAATLPDNDKFQVDVRIFGSQGCLLIDVERERVELRRHDGRHRSVAVTPGEGAYSCAVPSGRFIELIRGVSTENNSSVDVGARSVELLEALKRSAAAGGSAVRIDTAPHDPAASTFT